MTDNRAINPYRVVPESETYANHCFHTMRHFPDLSTGINTILKNMEKDAGKTRALRRKKVKASSSRILNQFCRSSVDEFTAVKDFHQTLIENRLAQRSYTGMSTDSRSPPSENFIYSAQQMDANSNPLSTANEKLMKVAIKYDNSDRGNEEIKGFEGMMMTIDEFDKQLKRGLHIWLTRPELEALFHIMAKTEGIDDELLDPEAFVTYFFQAGFRARQLHRQNSLTSIRSKDSSTASLRSSNNQGASTGSDEIDSPAAFMSAESTESDLESGLGKLRLAVRDLDMSSPLQATRVRLFQCRLTPLQFRLQLEKSFTLALTDAEAAALVRQYSTLSAPHCIDGHYFVHSLFPMQREGRQRDRQKHSKLAAVRHSLVNDRNQMDSVSKFLGR